MVEKGVILREKIGRMCGMEFLRMRPYFSEKLLRKFLFFFFVEEAKNFNIRKIRNIILFLITRMIRKYGMKFLRINN